MQKNPNLIQQKDKPEIYYYNGKEKFHIPDWYTFTHLRYALEEVTQMDDVTQIPNGDPFPSLDPEARPDEFIREIPEEYQYKYPICEAMAITRLAELQYKLKTGTDINFSVKAFYIDASGQGGGLSSTVAYKAAISKGFVLEDDCPTGDLSVYDRDWLTKWRDDVSNIGEVTRYKPKSYNVVAPRLDEASSEDIKDIIYRQGGFTGSVDTGYKNWNNGEVNPDEKFSPNHTVIYTGYDKENWLGFNHWEINPRIKSSTSLPIAWARNFNW